MSDRLLALDTSAAVPLLMAAHPAHQDVSKALAGRSLVLTAHSLLETYSVITRLPGDARVSPRDGERLIDGTFGAALLPTPATTRSLPSLLATLGIAGGAVYDALVAFTARENGAPLVTRDARARDTYALVGVELVVLG